MEKRNVFANIKSKDKKYEIKIGKPVHSRVNIIFNFNAVRYLKFVDHINSHEYVNVLSVHDYGDNTSGIAIELIKENSLSLLVEELPNDLFDYVECQEPSNIIFKGEKA